MGLTITCLDRPVCRLCLRRYDRLIPLLRPSNQIPSPFIQEDYSNRLEIRYGVTGPSAADLPLIAKINGDKWSFLSDVVLAVLNGDKGLGEFNRFVGRID